MASFPGMQDRTLNTLVAKLNVTTDIVQLQRLVKKAVKDDFTRALALPWHLVEHQLITTPSLHFFELLERTETTTAAQSTALAELLTRLPESKPVFGEFFTGWSATLNQVVYRAWPAAPAAFLERRERMRPTTRVGLDFVRGRRGESLSAAERADVLRTIAVGQASFYGLTTNAAMPWMVDGVEHSVDLRDLDALRTIATLFGTSAEWEAALADATKRCAWGLIENVMPVLAAMPLDELVAHFEARDRMNKRMFGDSSDARESVKKLFAARKDPADALERAKQALPDLAKALS